MFSKIKMNVASIGLFLIAMNIVTCENIIALDPQGENAMAEKTIQEVLKKHATELMSLPGVVGTAQGLCDGHPCIRVFVIEKTPELDQKIPDSLEGYPVMVEESGKIRALPKNRNQ